MCQNHVKKAGELLMKKILFAVLMSSFCFASEISYEKSENIVIDKQNKLMWQDDIEITQYLETFTTAKVYCDLLILNGYIDWRVPSIQEIQKIVDVSNKNALNKNFKFIKPNTYGTKTVFKSDVEYRWAIDFKSGKIITDKKTNKNYIRCVRDSK
jgi:hypothetical protein